MTQREQWIRDYEFKNEWRRSLPPEADDFRCWECDKNLEGSAGFARLCDACRRKEEAPMAERVPTKTTSVTLPRATYEAVVELAKADGRPFSNYVAWVLARHVEASKGNSPVKGD